jgi:hypothetical protein
MRNAAEQNVDAVTDIMKTIEFQTSQVKGQLVDIRKGFHDIADSLIDLKDAFKRLPATNRKELGNLDGWCRKHFGFGKDYANKLIRAKGVYDNLKAAGIPEESLPYMEGQTRYLTKAENRDPLRQVTIWRRAMLLAGEGNQPSDLEVHMAVEDLDRAKADGETLEEQDARREDDGEEEFHRHDPDQESPAAKVDEHNPYGDTSSLVEQIEFLKEQLKITKMALEEESQQKAGIKAALQAYNCGDILGLAEGRQIVFGGFPEHELETLKRVIRDGYTEAQMMFNPVKEEACF